MVPATAPCARIRRWRPRRSRDSDRPRPCVPGRLRPRRSTARLVHARRPHRQQAQRPARRREEKNRRCAGLFDRGLAANEPSRRRRKDSRQSAGILHNGRMNRSSEALIPSAHLKRSSRGDGTARHRPTRRRRSRGRSRRRTGPTNGDVALRTLVVVGGRRAGAVLPPPTGPGTRVVAWGCRRTTVPLRSS